VLIDESRPIANSALADPLEPDERIEWTDTEWLDIRLARITGPNQRHDSRKDNWVWYSSCVGLCVSHVRTLCSTLAVDCEMVGPEPFYNFQTLGSSEAVVCTYFLY
jgi:hypothetical protein